MSEEECQCADAPNSATKLACLNNSLASYLEEVHKLQNDNTRWTAKVKTLQKELEDCDRNGTWKKSETERSQAWTRTEELEKETKKYQLAAKKNSSRIRSLENKEKELKKELKATKSRASAAEESAASADLQRKAAEAEKSSLEQELHKMTTEMEQLQASMEEYWSDLQKETAKKIEFETRNKFLTEEMSFQKAIHKEELEKQQSEGISCRFPEPDDIQAIVDEIRKANAKDLASYRAKLDKTYKKKLSDLESQNTDLSATIARLNMEIKRFRSDREKKEEIAILRKNIEKLEGVLRSKDAQLDSMTQQHSANLARQDKELCELRKQCETLMELKMELDQEIAIYRTLLLKEESNLDIKLIPCGTKRPCDTSTTGLPASKKLCPDTPTTKDAGCIQISEVDPTGRFIEIKNLSEYTKRIGGYKIIHEVEGEEELTYTFHHTVKLQPQASVKVWGYKADGVVPSNSATDKIFKEPTWGVSHNAVTNLVTAKAEFVATYKQCNEPSTAQSLATPCPAETSLTEMEEDEQDSPDGQDQNRCVIS